MAYGNENHFHLCYLFAMNIAIGLAALTALATTAGGFLAIKSKDRLHLVLGLSAGLLLGLVVSLYGSKMHSLIGITPSN